MQVNDHGDLHNAKKGFWESLCFGKYSKKSHAGLNNEKISAGNFSK